MKVNIRFAQLHDLPALKRAAEQCKANNEEDYFEECLYRVQQGERDVYIAIRNDIVVGYVMLVWKPRYQPFRRLNIPEIQDLNVVPHLRRQSIGSQLMSHCEARCVEKGHTIIGIGVGLHRSFGPALRMYHNRGYRPDGGGAVYENKVIDFGELKPLDENFCIKMMREMPSKVIKKVPVKPKS